MIRDRLIVGLRDAALSEKLQMDSDLSLQTVISTARQRESVRKQQSVVRGDSQPNVDAVSMRPPNQGKSGKKWDSKKKGPSRFSNPPPKVEAAPKYVPSVEGHHPMDRNTVQHDRQHATCAKRRDPSSPSVGQRVFAQCR